MFVAIISSNFDECEPTKTDVLHVLHWIEARSRDHYGRWYHLDHMDAFGPSGKP